MLLNGRKTDYRAFLVSRLVWNVAQSLDYWWERGLFCSLLILFPVFSSEGFFFHVFSHFSNPKEYSYTLNRTSLQQEYPLKAYAIETTKSRTESKTYVQNGMVQRKCLNDDLIIDTKWLLNITTNKSIHWRCRLFLSVTRPYFTSCHGTAEIAKYKACDSSQNNCRNYRRKQYK